MIVRTGGFACELFEQHDFVGIELRAVGMRAVERKTDQFVTHRYRHGQRIDARVVWIEMRAQLVEPDDALVG